jgi:o-succinylbenzoate---CoA ligase
MARLGCVQTGNAAAIGFDQAPWCGGPGLALSGATGSAAGGPGPTSWTYDQLNAEAVARAALLLAQGLVAGDLVAVPERPGAQLILMQHALARVGAALLPVRHERPAAADVSLPPGTAADWAWQSVGAQAGRLVRLAARPRVDGAAWPSPLALVVETSGSSGTPRAAMLTQANLLAAADLSNRHLGFGAADTWLCCLPLRHIGGLSITYRCALAGARLLLHPGFDAAAVAADLQRQAVTHCSLVPPMLARLLALGAAPPVALRVVLVGGQSLSPTLARQAIDAGWPLHVTYGMTETASQIATSGRLAAPPAAGEVGHPLAGVELDCPGCADQPGRLRVRGPMVMAGYANPRREPGLGLTDGWFTTSDLACRAPDGGLRVLGRADQVLVTGGVNVHPHRVESLLAAAPGVIEVAVVGVADPVWGQRLVAVYRGESSPASLDAWCRAHLPGPERPRAFLPLPELPALESGKLDRMRVRELAQGACTAAPGDPPR